MPAICFIRSQILNDDDRDERAHGINAGHAWLHLADAVVVYTDHGISAGMEAGIRLAELHGKPVEMRSIKAGLADGSRSDLRWR